ncbi:polysaccharide biosynthesis tyrosine autokinase [Siccirubricoccus sp. G192]|uniref:GumC family protein n=1 Tax=Siccirubricoccus sp. G192 TaxID=2849651 RepID=UPI001C2C454F|nr:polysaccharide biosynthesis tyrosine autokinase [Siccirubricoccus sp. G192]MBV1797533.1 hypothetical protein [Siccirubricoccus sp. G192]
MIQTYSVQAHTSQIPKILRRRWRAVAATTLTFTALGLTLGVLLPPRYTAKAQLLLDQQVAQRVDSYDDAAVETWVELLVSPGHLRRLYDSLVAEPVDPAPTEFARPILTVAAEAAWGTLAGLFADAQPQSPTGVAEDSAPARQMPELDQLGLKLKSYKERQSRVVAVTFTWTDPDLAAAIANRSATLFLEQNLEARRLDRGRALEALRQRIPQARADLKRASEALAGYRVEHGLADADRIDQIDGQIAEINRHLSITSSNLATHGLPGGPQVMLPVMGGRPADSQRGSGPPQKLDADAVILASRMRYLTERLAVLQEASARARSAEAGLRELRLEAAAAAQVYEALVKQEADLRDETIRPEVRIVSLAAPPDELSSPDPIFFVPPAFVAGIIAGGLLAILRERTDRRVRQEHDVETALGLRCIGVVPRVRRIGRLRSLRALLLEPFAPYTKAIRSITVAMLGLPAERRPGKVILFTSSVDREGKTALAVSFAAYAALLRRSVLVIDLDLRRPGIGRLLGAGTGPGVLEVLQGTPPAEAIRSNSEFGIDYLPLSRGQVDPLLLTADERLRELLNTMRGRYDCIVIDGTPLIGNAEAQVLAALADHVILALKWGATELDTVQAAMREIRKAGHLGGEPVALSAVLTQVDLRRHATYGSMPSADPGAGDPARRYPTASPDRSSAGTS